VDLSIPSPVAGLINDVSPANCSPRRECRRGLRKPQPPWERWRGLDESGDVGPSGELQAPALARGQARSCPDKSVEPSTRSRRAAGPRGNGSTAARGGELKRLDGIDAWHMAAASLLCSRDLAADRFGTFTTCQWACTSVASDWGRIRDANICAVMEVFFAS
jgi:hypothetical protein